MTIEPAPLADKKPVDAYTANSMDKEKMRRRMEERKADRLAREAAAAQQKADKPPSYVDESPAQTRMRLAQEAAARQQGGMN